MRRLPHSIDGLPFINDLDLILYLVPKVFGKMGGSKNGTSATKIKIGMMKLIIGPGTGRQYRFLQLPQKKEPQSNEGNIAQLPPI